VLGITVWGQGDLSRDYGVDPDGFIPFPLIGRVKAAGSTPKELATQLTELLGKDYLVNPQVIVAVKEYLSQKVQVLGAAEKPGVYYLTGAHDTPRNPVQGRGIRLDSRQAGPLGPEPRNLRRIERPPCA